MSGKSSFGSTRPLTPDELGLIELTKVYNKRRDKINNNKQITPKEWILESIDIGCGSGSISIE